MFPQKHKMDKLLRIKVLTAHLGTINHKEMFSPIKDRVAIMITIAHHILHHCSAVLNYNMDLTIRKFVTIHKAVFQVQVNKQHQQLLLSLTFLVDFAFFAL